MLRIANPEKIMTRKGVYDKISRHAHGRGYDFSSPTSSSAAVPALIAVEGQTEHSDCQLCCTVCRNCCCRRHCLLLPQWAAKRFVATAHHVVQTSQPNCHCNQLTQAICCCVSSLPLYLDVAPEHSVRCACVVLQPGRTAARQNASMSKLWHRLQLLVVLWGWLLSPISH